MLALLGTLVTQQPAMSQTNTDITETNAPAQGASTATSAWPAPTNQSNDSGAVTAASNALVAASGDTTAVTNVSDTGTATNVADAAAVVNTNTPESTSDTNAPASAASTDTNASVAGVSVTNSPDAAMANTNTPEASTTNAVAAGEGASADTNAPATIPLIQFQDVPLTVAIENLARQAGINYLLDPKIGYGQPDQNGQIKPEPTLSIRWENVTAEQALLALLNNYDLQLVEDPRTKIGRISVKDPTAPAPLITRVIQLKWASTSNMLVAVQGALTDRRSHVLGDTRTSQLVVVATQGEQDGVDEMVNQLDKPTRQVLIETKIVQVSSTPSTSKGVNWAGTLQAQNVSFGNGLATASTTTTVPPGGNGVTTINSASGGSPLLPGGFSLNTLTGLTPGIGFLNAEGVQAVLSFLNQSYDAQVLSTPRIVTLDNETASISVTRMFPVVNVTIATAGVSSGGATITYSNIGTTLEVTPRITANDYIWLKVIPDVSSFFGTASQSVGNTAYTADIFDLRHIETQVMIPNNNTLVMGGLIQDNPTAQWYQVPLLGDIPYLGWAFKSKTVTMDKDNLVIFITPTIVKDDDFQPATTDFLASKPTPMKQQMDPHSAWDRPEPDWSNPAPQPNEFDYNNK